MAEMHRQLSNHFMPFKVISSSCDLAGIPQDQFVKAMKLVGEEFTSCVHGYRDIWLPAREIVQKAIIGRCQVTS